MKTLAASLFPSSRSRASCSTCCGVWPFTCIISVLGVIMGLIVGSLLALARTYCKKGPSRILGWFATAYIELFRNTPYLLWIFICVVFCPCPDFFARKMFGLTSVEMKLLFKAALALILFNSSVIAEIVRGGLNGVSKGQFEAGYAQGFNTVEVLLYIVLPQAYRNIVPTLLSQVITTIKDLFLSGQCGHHRADGPHPSAVERRRHLQRPWHGERLRRHGAVRCGLCHLLRHQLHVELCGPFDAEPPQEGSGLCPGKGRMNHQALIQFPISQLFSHHCSVNAKDAAVSRPAASLAVIGIVC